MERQLKMCIISRTISLFFDIDSYNKLVENFNFKYAVEFDDEFVAVHKVREGFP